MEVLRFKLKGENAFFKKPEVNTYCYFTFGNIHKIALLGIFGAIIGCNGYGQMRDILAIQKKKQQKLTASYPDFYEQLKDIKVSILPVNKADKGIFPRKIQAFNNSVGYASQEQGGNLIVKEQWLEKPQWEICLLLDSPIANKIKDKIVNHECVYYPYLGKNDHLADIVDICVETIEKVEDDVFLLDCFAPEDKISSLTQDELNELLEDNEDRDDGMAWFKYREALPYQIDAYANSYIMKNFVYTNEYLAISDEVPVYSLSDKKKIIFY